MATTIEDAVSILRTALAIVSQKAGSGLGAKLLRAEVTLELEATRQAGGKVEFKVFGLGAEVEAGGEWKRKHTVKFRLTPAPSKAALGPSESEQLADAIIALAADAKRVKAMVAGEFILGEFSLDLSFGFTKEGKAAVILGGGGASANSHSLALTFQPA